MRHNIRELTPASRRSYKIGLPVEGLIFHVRQPRNFDINAIADDIMIAGSELNV